MWPDARSNTLAWRKSLRHLPALRRCCPIRLQSGRPGCFRMGMANWGKSCFFGKARRSKRVQRKCRVFFFCLICFLPFGTGSNLQEAAARQLPTSKASEAGPCASQFSTTMACNSGKSALECGACSSAALAHAPTTWRQSQLRDARLSIPSRSVGPRSSFRAALPEKLSVLAPSEAFVGFVCEELRDRVRAPESPHFVCRDWRQLSRGSWPASRSSSPPSSASPCAAPNATARRAPSASRSRRPLAFGLGWLEAMWPCVLWEAIPTPLKMGLWYGRTHSCSLLRGGRLELWNWGSRPTESHFVETFQSAMAAIPASSIAQSCRYGG